MSKVLIFEAELSGVRGLKDKSLSLSLHTPELSAEKKVDLLNIQGEYVSVLMRLGDFQESDADTLKEYKASAFDDRKTPAQRLRGVLYRLWEQDPEGFRLSDDHYLYHLNKIVEHYKTKFND